jgi:hypothetical protein
VMLCSSLMSMRSKQMKFRRTLMCIFH